MPDTLTVREQREVGRFAAIELRYFGQVVLHHGEACTLEVEGDPDVVPKVHSEVRDGTLVLEVGENWLERLTSGLLLVANRPLRYHVTLPHLDAIVIAGSGEVEGSAWGGERLRVRVSGQGEVRLTDLGYASLDAVVSGRGELQLAGRAEQAHFTISGSADIHAGELPLQRGEVKIAGQGNVEMRVSERLDVRIAGFGSVRYHGEPMVKQVISGAGTVERIGA
jgi:hypothetical protein